MSNEVTVTLNSDDLAKLRRRYGDEFIQKVVMITEKYIGEAGIVKREARRIIEDAGQKPLKFFEKPFEKYAPKYVAELEGLLK